MKQPRSFTLKSHGGLLRELITDVQVAEAFDPEKTNPFPEHKEYRALWDTGATGTVITKKIANDLHLLPTGMSQVHHANGACLQPTYLINIRLPNGVGFQQVRVVEGVLQNFDVLIGMDIIVMGDFVITNTAGVTTFSFRFPSCECIDFVQQANNQSVTSRNSPCPCGSGKKYKRCHGR